MKSSVINPIMNLFCSFVCVFSISSCQKEVIQQIDDKSGLTGVTTTQTAVTESVLLVIDEDAIDNGNAPNNFSETAVNDQLARVGQRQTLKYFKDNVGKTIDLFSGEVGDEGFHALKAIPASWISAGPTGKGSLNFLQAGPGLGGGSDNKEVLLDKIPNITPLRATGLKMLVGRTILAVVYDGDVSINYDPLNGNLQGANLGRVALEILQVTKRTGGSSGSLPRVKVKIVNVETASSAPLKLFSNAPVPRSSSEPFDINPPATAPEITLTDAR